MATKLASTPPSHPSTSSLSSPSASPRSQQEQRRLTWKVDLLLLPLLTLCYGLQFWDKAVLGSATLFGILPALDLQTTSTTGVASLARYSLASSAFYYGYMAGVIPLSLLCNRFSIARFLGSCIIVWGGILLLTPAITSWKGLVVQRVFLGFVESSVSPGFLLVTRRWYTKQELPLRVGVWYSATGIFSIVSGLINYGLGTRTPNPNLATWKSLFLVPGCLTVFFGLVVLLLLPSGPNHAPLVRIPGYNVFSAIERDELLDKTQRQMLTAPTATTKDNSSDSGKSSPRQIAASPPWQWYQVWEALLDIKVWLFTLMATAIYVTNGAVTSFGPIIVRSMGYTPTQAILYQTPCGAVTVVSIWVVVLLNAYFLQDTKGRPVRIVLLVLSCLPTVIGATLIWGSFPWGSKAAPLTGYYLLGSFGAPYVLLLALVASNVSGSTKASLTSGMVFVGYNAGNIAGSYVLTASEANVGYETTWKVIIGMMAATIGLSGILAGVLKWENVKRDKEGEEASTDCGQEDLTDRENRSFRYVL